ncbi:MAG: hypothetical protein H8D80_01975 [Proteobacteria bacterium]|nr:hypothetical protein [Pseudomonadota bacterium]
MSIFKERLRNELKESINYVLVELKNPDGPIRPPTQSAWPPPPTPPTTTPDDGGISGQVIDILRARPDATVLDVFEIVTPGQVSILPEKEATGGAGIGIPGWNAVSMVLSILTQKKMIPTPYVITLQDAVSVEEENAIDTHNIILTSPAINETGTTDPLIEAAFEGVTEG